MIVSYAWLKDFLGDTTPSAEEVARLLGEHAFEIEGVEEVEGDTVIDVDVLPNRSSDCLSHRGIAREIATLINTPLVYDPLHEVLDLPQTDAIVVDIADTTACPRFTAALMTGIEVKESPAWLQARLKALGQRSINNIVDATNYVMYALGQPLHAYDAGKFPQTGGKWQFEVRFAREGEVVSLLAEGGKEEDRDVTLTGSELLIVDGSSDTPIGLAGVKGGRFAGVDSTTTDIIVEAAHFDPILTRKTARGLGIVIDASKRFENEPSRELPLYAQTEIIKLITDIAGGSCEGIVDIYPEPYAPTVVAVEPTRVNRLLGLSLESSEMVSILERAGITVEEKDRQLLCTGPWERTDLTIAEDFIEEIGRIYGYDHVQSVVPETVPLTELNVRHYYSEKVRETLIDLGFSEVITSSFRKKDEIQLRNALASDKSYMRSTLRKNIAETLDKNAGFVDLLGAADTRVFEIGTVFTKEEGTVSEHVSLCVGVRQKVSGYTPKDDALIADVVRALETALGAACDFTIEKGVAELNLSALMSELPAPAAYEPVTVAPEIAYAPFSVYPAVTRDIALWVPAGTTAEEVEAVLNDNAGELRVRTTLFDEFTKDDRISYAFRLVFQSKEKTLTDSEVNSIMDAVYAAAVERQFEVR
ncbi:phenylalanine--tRNA ligase subunit beta [Candidatus Nomurabacteria bacterium]|nr:phenylalanine--tRNA ligase subunit beta [Candidatus Nomurabacteria bacterium]